jgi:hypothetical protein
MEDNTLVQPSVDVTDPSEIRTISNTDNSLAVWSYFYPRIFAAPGSSELHLAIGGKL